MENGFKVKALLDTIIKIDIMTKKLIEGATLAMRRGPKLELVWFHIQVISGLFWFL